MGAPAERSRGLGRPLSDVLGAHDDVEPPALLSTTTEAEALDLALDALAAAFPADTIGYCRAAPADPVACRIAGRVSDQRAVDELSRALVGAARSITVVEKRSSTFVASAGRGSSIGVLRSTGAVTRYERRLIEALAALVRSRVEPAEL